MMPTWKRETREAADNPQHPWDKEAISWPHLNATSVVWEVGSFKGRWALQMARLYNPYLYCFEPQRWAAGVTREVLKRFNASVYDFGLGSTDAMLSMGEHGTDGCSFTKDSRETATCEMREITSVLDHLGIQRIDLMLVNIEGGEYDLIPYMFNRSVFPEILIVQFHEGDYKVLRHLIESHYSVEWDYGRTLAAFRWGGAE